MAQTFDGIIIIFLWYKNSMVLLFSAFMSAMCRECFCLQCSKTSLAAWNIMTCWSWPFFLHHVRWLKLCLSKACMNLFRIFHLSVANPYAKTLYLHRTRSSFVTTVQFARSFQLFTSIGEQYHGFYILPNKQYPYYWGKQNQQQKQKCWFEINGTRDFLFRLLHI